jgi:mannose-6-phosphate isomerase class I
LDLNAYTAEKFDSRNEVVNTEYKKAMIGQCKYFTVNKYVVDGECVLPPNDLSFQSIIVLNGDGEISDGDNMYKTLAGDTWFVANKVNVTLRGNVELLVVNV